MHLSVSHIHFTAFQHKSLSNFISIKIHLLSKCTVIHVEALLMCTFMLTDNNKLVLLDIFSRATELLHRISSDSIYSTLTHNGTLHRLTCVCTKNS